MQANGLPRDGGVPVVTGEVDRRDARRVEDAERVRDEMLARVGSSSAGRPSDGPATVASKVLLEV